MVGKADKANDVYNVEAIWDKTYNEERKRYEFCVKWQGYPASELTWEPYENLQTCLPLLYQFEQEYAKKEQEKNKAGTSHKIKKTASAISAPTGVQKNKTVAKNVAKKIKKTKKVAANPKSKKNSSHSTKKIVKVEKNSIQKKKTVEMTRAEKLGDDESSCFDSSDDETQDDSSQLIMYPGGIEVLAKLPLDRTPVEMLGMKYIPEIRSFVYLILWKYKSDYALEPELIASGVFKEKYPEIVINFYQKHLQLKNDPRTESEGAKKAVEAVLAAEKRQAQRNMNSGTGNVQRKKVPLLESSSSSSDETSSDEDAFVRVKVVR